ncbi:cytochrome P450 [Lophiotrema nucula]|uniref:Cytochrome P450 n=1 Tax=Lophiotrema nucula TaxID=690887 RepID=A0A6A5Z982_9PLEO|nr:cytochrome P450 [Lophiotrema nucula]
MKTIGISKEGIKKAFQSEGVTNTARHDDKHLVALCKIYQVQQLYPGKRLHELLHPALAYINRRLDVLEANTLSNPAHEGGITLSLYSMISETFTELGQEAYFGKTLAEIEPKMVSLFMDFDAVAWQVLYQYPTLLCRRMVRSKARMQAALEGYFSRPVKDRSDAAWMILELESDMNRRDVSLPDIALFFFQLYWSINGNMKKAPFWMLSFILFRPGLVDAIRKEVQPAFSADGFSMDYLSNSCPLLHSVWDETLRVTAFAASVRFLTEDVRIGGKILRRGNRLMIPQRQLHFNPHAFGEDAASFNHKRFLEQSKLKKHSSFRPFGGGTTLCPGRRLTEKTSLAFVAMILQKFDLELEPHTQSFPIATEGNPSIGLVDVEQGSDLKVNLRIRTTVV